MNDRRTPRHDPPPSATEAHLLALLGHHLQEIEPLPAGLLEAAVGAYSWRTAEAELLELLVDSAEHDLALVRAEAAARVMAFGSEHRGVHFECHRDGDAYRLDGLVHPPAAVTVVVERDDATMSTKTDDVGSFTITAVAAGSLRLLVRELDGAVAMVTPWFVLEG